MTVCQAVQACATFGSEPYLKMDENGRENLGVFSPKLGAQKLPMSDRFTTTYKRQYRRKEMSNGQMKNYLKQQRI